MRLDPHAAPSLVCLALTAGCVQSARQPATPPSPRHVEDGILVSTCLPPLRLRPDPGFKYLGGHPFRIRDLAGGERHVFVDAEGSRIRRLLLLRFEGFSDGVDHTYDYRITNPVALGGETYHQNVYLFSANGDLAPEGIATKAFLEGHGLSWSVADAGHTIAEIAEDGGICPAFAPVAESLTARSLRAFTILPPGGTASCAS